MRLIVYNAEKQKKKGPQHMKTPFGMLPDGQQAQLYEITFENGAHGTLFFELCESDSPVEDSYGAWELLPFIILGFGLICAVAGIIALIIIVLGVIATITALVLAVLFVCALFVILIVSITRKIRAKRRK